MLLSPVTPDQIKVAGTKGHKIHWVDQDVLGIVQRVKEIDPNLSIILHENHRHPFVVMEQCVDGSCRMVSRYAALDARILDDLRYMLSVPFDKRFEALTRRIDAENEAQEHKWQDSEQWDEFVWNFRQALRDANMADIPDTRKRRGGQRRGNFH